jgi:hypothetical protein
LKEPVVTVKKDKEKKKEKKKKKDKGIQELEIQERPQPKAFETKEATLSSKLQDKVKIIEPSLEIDLEGEKIDLQKGEYIKLVGITSTDRIPLYCSNNNLVYLLELTNNLDFIATSILGGELDKMLLISSLDEKEKCQWYVKNKIIYIVYGQFPDKKGKWLLEQISNHFTELIKGKDINSLSKMEKYEMESEIKKRTLFILREYLKLQEIFSDQDLGYIEDNIRIDYVGLSSKSIGVISLLMGDELHVELPGKFENIEEEIEMKESVLTAKIEAIAANTIGNTGAMPKWIAVKLGFQHYRFLTFQKYPNDYFIYLLSEGNLDKIKIVEDKLNSYIGNVTEVAFSGNLKAFNQLKMTMREIFNQKRVFN